MEEAAAKARANFETSLMKEEDEKDLSTLTCSTNWTAVLLRVLPMIVDHDPHWDRWEHFGRCYQRPCGCCLSQRGLIATARLYRYCDPCLEAWYLTTVCHSWFRTVRRFANHRWGRDSKKRYAWPRPFVPSSIAEDNAKEIA